MKVRVALKDLEKLPELGEFFLTPSCFQHLQPPPNPNRVVAAQEKGGHETAREARPIGNAIRSHSKEGTLAATDKRGHSPATPGEEGGRNH